MQFKFILFIVLILNFPLVRAQQSHETISSAGGNASGSGGSAAYSVGQLVFSTNFVTSGTVSEGVHQPFEISIIDEVIEFPEIELNVKAYPNPASGYIILKTDALFLQNISLSYQLFDLSGKLLENKSIISIETEIDMQCYSPAAYILKVIKSKINVNSSLKKHIEANYFNFHVLKTFKIIKN